MSFDLKTAIGSIAPTLATMLSGPLAGAAVSALVGAFGLGPSAGADDITKVMQGGTMTPETVAACAVPIGFNADIALPKRACASCFNLSSPPLAAAASGLTVPCVRY